jgi:hypothetical protein
VEVAHGVGDIPAVERGGAAEIGLAERSEVCEDGEDSVVVAARPRLVQALVQHLVRAG